MRHRIAFIAFMVCTVLAAKASDFKYLVLEKSDGTTVSLEAVGLTMTFQDGNLVTGDGTTVSLESLQRMFFSNDVTPSAIETVAADQNDGEVEVYSMGGAFVGRFGSAASARRSLSRGVYLLKSGGKTVKIAVG